MSHRFSLIILIGMIARRIRRLDLSCAADCRSGGRCRKPPEHRHRCVPAAHQDDHRAAGVFNAGRRHREHGRRRAARPHRRCAPCSGSSAPRSFRCCSARARERSATRRRARPAAAARRHTQHDSGRRADAEGFRHARVPALDHRGDGDNEILQIVVFSLFMGVALASLGERAAGIVLLAEQMVEVMLKDHRLRDAGGAVRGVRGDRRDHRAKRSRHPLTYSKFLLSFYFALARVVAGHRRVRRPRDRPPRRAADGVDARSRSWLRSPPPVPKRRSRGFSNSSRSSACRGASAASCCRSAIRSTSTAR